LNHHAAQAQDFANRKAMTLAIDRVRVPAKEPMRISGYTFTHAETVVAVITTDEGIGMGEANCVYFRGETAESVAQQLESVRPIIEAGITREEAQDLLPAGGARNELDCALWALESSQSGVPIWQLAGLPEPRPTPTTRTLSAGSPEAMASFAANMESAERVKLKLLRDDDDAARVTSVRAALPEAWIMVDANQGLDRASYLALLPSLEAANVALIEQPFPIGHEDWIADLPRRIMVAADESACTRGDLPKLAGLYDMVNLKLDKTGGFTEALAMAHQARKMGFHLMVGCMSSGSLGMAPAYLIGQLCDVCDIDGPLYLVEDRVPGLVYSGVNVTMPANLWGV
jgi:L-Ala-D/L-Glu epimerase